MTNEVEDECPNCNSIAINFSAFEFVDGQGYYPCECADCGTYFQQWYKLKYIEKNNIENHREIKE